LPIWVDLMRRIGESGDEPFPRPPGLVRRQIDPETGRRATRGCPERRDEWFLRGTEPDEPCERHGGQLRRGFWRRLFGKTI
jgi:membrane carboxypeptidase/penicillin-binding protein